MQTINTPAEILGRIPRKAFFHLVPRYTCGSPAMVDLGEAARVADHEKQAHLDYLTGIHGEQNQQLANAKGLHGIAYARWEKGGKVWRLDLLTGKEEIELPRLSWKERERIRELRMFAPDATRKTELAALEHRLEIHRETVAS